MSKRAKECPLGERIVRKALHGRAIVSVFGHKLRGVLDPRAI